MWKQRGGSWGEVYKVHHVSVVIHKNETENVGFDGELLSDILTKRKS